MSQPFGYTGKPGTCLWCGRLFKPETRLVEHGYLSTCCNAETTEVTVQRPLPGWRRTPGVVSEDVKLHRCNACGETNGRHLKVSHEPTGKRYGYMGSQHFCTLRCGFSFAETAADDGTRYERRDKKTVEST